MVGVAVRAGDQLVCGQFIAQACEELLAAPVDMADSQSGSARGFAAAGFAANEGCHYIYLLLKSTCKMEGITDQRKEANSGGKLYANLTVSTFMSLR